MTPSKEPCQYSPGEVFDLGRHLIDQSHDTFLLRVSENSMIDAGIRAGDILIADSSLEPQPSDVVVTDSFTLKRFAGKRHLSLVPPKGQRKPIEASRDADIRGVITFVIRQLKQTNEPMLRL